MNDIQSAQHRDRLFRVESNPSYIRLLRRRSRFSRFLTLLMIAVFFGYILLIAFNKELLARPVLGGTTSLGIPIGIGVILTGILLTGVYVHRANTEFDRLVQAIRDEAGE